MSALQRIFCVEDDPNMQQIAQLSLESIGGFVVKICGTGKEALDEVVAFSPDIILLDVMVPDMNGTEIFKAIREIDALSSVPIAFLTGTSNQEELDALRALGAIDIISKPFDPMTLSTTVESLWQSSRL